MVRRVGFLNSIRSKAYWRDHQSAGVFNSTHHYSYEEFLRIHRKFDGTKLFCYRCTSGMGGARFICMSKKKMVAQIKKGTAPDGYWVAERVNHSFIVVQGEYDGIRATISFEKLPQREALAKSSRQITRVHLLGMIGRENYEILEEAIAFFNQTFNSDDNPVVEFAVFSRSVGFLSKNMIIWEIRNY